MMGTIPPLLPSRLMARSEDSGGTWVEVTCLEDAERRFVRAMGDGFEIEDSSVYQPPWWEIERQRAEKLEADRRELLRSNRIGAGLILGFIVAALLAGLRIAGAL